MRIVILPEHFTVSFFSNDYGTMGRGDNQNLQLSTVKYQKCQRSK